MIESYDFGKIKIDGKIYSYDVIVFADKVKEWWREDSHWVDIDDIKEILENQPKKIIFGTGYSGLMDVAEETKKILEKSGIEVIIEPTKKACDIFNKFSVEKENVIAALHLTC